MGGSKLAHRWAWCWRRSWEFWMCKQQERETMSYLVLVSETSKPMSSDILPTTRSFKYHHSLNIQKHRLRGPFNKSILIQILTFSQGYLFYSNQHFLMVVSINDPWRSFSWSKCSPVNCTIQQYKTKDHVPTYKLEYIHIISNSEARVIKNHEDWR